MSRDYGKKLTKEMLQEWGITSVVWDEEIQNWIIDRYWFKNNSKTKVHTTLKIRDAVCKHKFTVDKSYPIVSFSYKQTRVSVPLSRFVYAWFYGSIEEGSVCDHKDNNPYNNYINADDLNDPKNNLQVLSVGENLAKRFIDNPLNNKNQYTTKNYKELKEKYDLNKICKDLFDSGISYDQALQIILLIKIGKSYEEAYKEVINKETK